MCHQPHPGTAPHGERPLAPARVEQRQWPRSPQADQAQLLHQTVEHPRIADPVGDPGDAHGEHALRAVPVPRVDGGFHEGQPLLGGTGNCTEQASTPKHG